MIELGAGIAIGSFFISIGGVAIIYIRAYFNTQNGTGDGNSNGYVRKGEHDQGLQTIETRLSSIEKKLDSICNYMYDQESEINNLDQRITTIETVQKMWQHKSSQLEEVK